MTTCNCPLCEYLDGITNECEFHLKDLCEECKEMVELSEAELSEEEDDIPS